MHRSWRLESSLFVFLTQQSANPVPVYLKSQSEFNRGNFAKAVKLLNHLAPLPATATPSVSGDCYPSLFYNNLACINSAMGKSTIAAVYFNMALEENTKAMQGLPPAGPNGLVDYNQVPLQSIGTSRFSEFVYNLGTQLLISGQPTQAFPLLVEASHTYHQNPRLWCRLAEACIAKHKNVSEVSYSLMHVWELSFINKCLPMPNTSKMVAQSFETFDFALTWMESIQRKMSIATPRRSKSSETNAFGAALWRINGKLG